MKIELIIVPSYRIYLPISIEDSITNSRVRSICFYLYEIYVGYLSRKNEINYYVVAGETIVSLGIDIPRHRRERGDASNYFCSTLHS